MATAELTDEERERLSARAEAVMRVRVTTRPGGFSSTVTFGRIGPKDGAAVRACARCLANMFEGAHTAGFGWEAVTAPVSAQVLRSAAVSALRVRGVGAPEVLGEKASAAIVALSDAVDVCRAELEGDDATDAVREFRALYDMLTSLATQNVIAGAASLAAQEVSM